MTSFAAKRPARRTQKERRTSSGTAFAQVAIEVVNFKGVAGDAGFEARQPKTSGVPQRSSVSSI